MSNAMNTATNTVSRLATASAVIDRICATTTHDVAVAYAGRAVAALEGQPLRIEVKRLGQIGGRGRAVVIGAVVVTPEGVVEVRSEAQYRAEVAALAGV